MLRLMPLSICLLAMISTANAAIVITDVAETTNVSSFTASESSIEAAGVGYSPYLDKVEYDCCAGQKSFIKINFDVVNQQYVLIDATLKSAGSIDSNLSQLQLYKDSPKEYYLNAASEAEGSTLEVDERITDYTSSGRMDISREFFLTEGSYVLQAGAYADQYYDDGSSSYTFALTAIPLPAGGWLFVSALIGLLGAKRHLK